MNPNTTQLRALRDATNGVGGSFATALRNFCHRAIAAIEADNDAEDDAAANAALLRSREFWKKWDGEYADLKRKKDELLAALEAAEPRRIAQPDDPACPSTHDGWLCEYVAGHSGKCGVDGGMEWGPIEAAEPPEECAGFLCGAAYAYLPPTCNHREHEPAMRCRRILGSGECGLRYDQHDDSKTDCGGVEGHAKPSSGHGPTRAPEIAPNALRNKRITDGDESIGGAHQVGSPAPADVSEPGAMAHSAGAGIKPGPQSPPCPHGGEHAYDANGTCGWIVDGVRCGAKQPPPALAPLPEEPSHDAANPSHAALTLKCVEWMDHARALRAAAEERGREIEWLREQAALWHDAHESSCERARLEREGREQAERERDEARAELAASIKREEEIEADLARLRERMTDEREAHDNDMADAQAELAALKAEREAAQAQEPVGYAIIADDRRHLAAVTFEGRKPTPDPNDPNDDSALYEPLYPAPRPPREPDAVVTLTKYPYAGYMVGSGKTEREAISIILAGRQSCKVALYALDEEEWK